MKTSLSFIIVIVFGALFLAPPKPLEYPPKDVTVQQMQIRQRETNLKFIIGTIEYNIEIDSLQFNKVR